MNENIFKQLLGEMLESDFAEFDNSPEWKPSLKLRLAMKRIFARYERNVRKLKEKDVKQHTEPSEPTEHRRSYLSITQRLAIALIIIFLLTLTGCVVAAFISKDFHGKVYDDNTLLFPVNLENAPLSIENTYALNFIPDGFELIDTQSSPTNISTTYGNFLTRQTIVFSQWVKSYYKPHINTEYYSFEQISINGTIGLYVNFSRNDTPCTLLIWDNGEYIIEISANLDKENVLNLLNININQKFLMFMFTNYPLKQRYIIKGKYFLKYIEKGLTHAVQKNYRFTWGSYLFKHKPWWCCLC